MRWRAGVASLFTALLLCPLILRAGEKLGEGKILVADRRMTDEHFARSVILLVTYNNQGALGLILNFRSDVSISRALKGIRDAQGQNDPVFLGGPVEQTGVLALINSKLPRSDAKHVVGRVYMLGTKELLQQALAAKLDSNVLRLYLGYAGWAPHQLQDEVDAGAWRVIPSDPAIIFDDRLDTLWERMLARGLGPIVKNEHTSPELWPSLGKGRKAGVRAENAE